MTNRRLPFSALFLAAAASACDAQTTSDYPGELLLSVSGRIVGQVPDGELVPALAFTDGNAVLPTTYLMDLDVQGAFPSEFSLHFYDAPPPEAMITPTVNSWGPVGLSASIVAVPKGHPTVVVDHIIMNGEGCGGVNGDIYCQRDKIVYGGKDNQEILYQERTLCDRNWQNCQTTTTGDPSTTITLAQILRGVVANYRVLYAAEPVSARSVAGAFYGPLSAGYHLINLRPATDAEKAESERCGLDANQPALARFNETYGTTYTDPEELLSDMEQYRKYMEFYWDVYVELGCRYNSGVIATPVPGGPENPVTMELSTDASQLDQTYLF